jgi:hypothetical protein
MFLLTPDYRMADLMYILQHLFLGSLDPALALIPTFHLRCRWGLPAKKDKH